MNALMTLPKAIAVMTDPCAQAMTTIDQLPAIALAASPLDLWDEMLDFCFRIGCGGMAFFDLAERSGPPVLVKTSFPVGSDLGRLRQALTNSHGAAVMLDEVTLAVPAFGPRGLEAALLVRLGHFEACLPDCAEALCAVFQLAYSRYRQMAPGHREDDISLSDREREIMQWVVRGKSNSVIGTILGISASTVDTYMRRIFRKLDVGDRTSAAMRAVALGAIG
jgi:DNA-binding CsgD family transcriptional regulator